jgi:hypothetical protein
MYKELKIKYLKSNDYLREGDVAIYLNEDGMPVETKPMIIKGLAGRRVKRLNADYLVYRILQKRN